MDPLITTVISVISCYKSNHNSDQLKIWQKEIKKKMLFELEILLLTP